MKTKKAVVLLAAAIGLVFASAAMSQTGKGGERVSKSLDAEFEWLQEEMVVFTEIATKTKMDADLVPGMVTVLKGEELERKGARTVGEALALVPGLDVGGARGAAPNMRGVEMMNAYKIKGLLNGVAINASLTGEISPLYFIPLEQVERIEVIRGPGSAIYGKWAYLGVINVITYQQGNRIAARYGSHDTIQGALIASYANADAAIKTSLNIGGYQRERTDVVSGQDFPASLGMPSHAPGPVNDARQAPHGVFNINYQDVYLTGQWTEVNFGSGYGLTEALPPLDDRTQIGERSWGIEAGWEREISSDLRLKLLAGLKEYTWDSGDNWLYPAGFITPEEDTIGRSHYQDRVLESVFNVHWRPWSSHQLLFGLEYEHLAMQDDAIWMSVNYDPITYAPVSYQRFKGDKNWLDVGKSRDIYSVMLQDQFEINPQLIITGGLRYDQYEDDNNRFSRLTPRLAGVFQASAHHIVKLQYAEAFRPPAFMEMYAINNPVYAGNPDLEAEVVKTYEAGYIFRFMPFVGKLTVFHAKMEDLVAVTNKQYANCGEAKLTGAEAEADLKILKWADLNANISYSDTEDQDGKVMKGTARWLGSAALLLYPQPDWTTGLVYRYMDKRFRAETDERSRLDGFHKIDFTLSVDHLLIKGLTLRAGVKNVFEADIRYPSPPVFPDDYPATGREFWVQASYQF